MSLFQKLSKEEILTFVSQRIYNVSQTCEQKQGKGKPEQLLFSTGDLFLWTIAVF